MFSAASVAIARPGGNTGATNMGNNQAIIERQATGRPRAAAPGRSHQAPHPR